MRVRERVREILILKPLPLRSCDNESPMILPTHKQVRVSAISVTPFNIYFCRKKITFSKMLTKRFRIAIHKVMYKHAYMVSTCTQYTCTNTGD